MMSSTSMKRISFKKTISSTEYMLEIRETAFEPPIIYKHNQDKALHRVYLEQTDEPELKEFCEKIEQMLKESNRDYMSILPGAQFEIDNYDLQVSNLIEGYENFKKIEIYPQELHIWVEFTRNEEPICDVEYVIQNGLRDKSFPYWRMRNHNEKYYTSERSTKFEDIILQQGLFFEESLNKPHRLQHLYLDI